MANIADEAYIIKLAIRLLQKHRCGFDDCVAKIDYFPMRDEYRFAAQGNILLIFNLGLRPSYDKFILALIPKWADPIC